MLTGSRRNGRTTNGIILLLSCGTQEPPRDERETAQISISTRQKATYNELMGVPFPKQ